jgi:hypothetical protein
MYNARIIITLAVVFLVLATLPFWYGLIRATGKTPPVLEVPIGQKECVMPVNYMKENHMTLLNKWRDEIVRDGDRSPVVVNRVKYEKSLSGTCLKCHAKKSAFCDRCHAYLSVSPSCWDCHYFPREKNEPE